MIGRLSWSAAIGHSAQAIHSWVIVGTGDPRVTEQQPSGEGEEALGCLGSRATERREAVASEDLFL